MTVLERAVIEQAIRFIEHIGTCEREPCRTNQRNSRDRRSTITRPLYEAVRDLQIARERKAS